MWNFANIFFFNWTKNVNRSSHQEKKEFHITGILNLFIRLSEVSFAYSEWDCTVHRLDDLFAFSPFGFSIFQSVWFVIIRDQYKNRVYRQAGQAARHTFQSPACLFIVSGRSDLQLVPSPVCRQSVALSSPSWGNPPTWIKSAVLKNGWGPMLKKRSQFWTLVSRSFRAVTFQEGRGGLSTVWFPHFYEFVWKTFSPFWAH